MTHDQRIDLAMRRLLAAREMQRSAAKYRHVPGDPHIDWPMIAQVERQQARAELRALLDMRKQNHT